ncbi:MAG: class I SAM-dependent methyltransferase [Planctomycetota bacterium]|nr:MAG: class I SAM-dependent methyltransferase [Planctomycetota bacterium]
MDGAGRELPFDLGPFAELPRACRTPELLAAAAAVDQAVAAAAREILAEVGEEEEAIPPERRPAHRWLRAFLAQRPIAEDPGARLAAELGPARLRPYTEAALALVERAARSYPAFLRGEVLGAQVLFAAEALPLWERYFSAANLTNHAINAQTAALAERTTRGRKGLRALEVGGGCGSSGALLLEVLGERVACYTYTDIAPALIARGRRTLRAVPTRAERTFRRLDIDRPPAEQGVPPGSVDLLCGVNVLHAARDLVRCLRSLREALAPGGTLVLGEAVRPRPDAALAIEFVFQLAEGFRRFTPVEGLRERGGFLWWEAWPELLRRAGFAAVETAPRDMSAALRALPSYSLCALAATP